MFKKELIITICVLLITFFNPTAVCAEETRYIEIFDTKQDKVIKTVQPSKDLYKMVVDCINGINEIYVKVNPIQDNGYVIRIPVTHAIEVNNKWLNTIVSEVFILVPENSLPFFIVLDNNSRPLCFPFTEEIAILSRVLDFRLN